ncbi:MAG: aspartate-semialdehyde dehydrogenase [Alphaproteobacteria bacterium]|nr:aspartate-semialdehyde dehydrogenase [Alphaproteobacteria bacterium]
MRYTNSKEYNIAIIGATGSTGSKTIEILAERKFPISNLIPIASNRFSGREVSFKNNSIKVQTFENADLSSVDLAFFCAGNAVSRRYAPQLAEKGCVIIDKSSHFRLDSKVPLVIPEVNANALKKGSPLGIISTPNCITVPLAMVLKALSEISAIKRVVVSTYQSVSGAGRRGVDELFNQSKTIIAAGTPSPEVFPKQIAYNIIPCIGDIMALGNCDEEEKVTSEICKILKSDVKVAVTCVRVPTFIGHCMSLACEFSKPVSEHDAYEAFENFEGIVTLDRRENGGIYATPIDIQGEDGVYVSRVRKDYSTKNGLMLWIACDNLRKGAALNSVQIAEELIAEDPQLRIFRKKF